MRIRHAIALGLGLMVASPHLFAAEPTKPTITTEQPPPLQADEKVDVNTANQVELERLPGIGPKLALAIINHRATFGEFVLPADVMKVPGIREGRYAQIKTWITMDNDATMLWSDTTQKPPIKPQR